jgi:hypothetical protein
MTQSNPINLNFPRYACDQRFGVAKIEQPPECSILDFLLGLNCINVPPSAADEIDKLRKSCSGECKTIEVRL